MIHEYKIYIGSLYQDGTQQIEKDEQVIDGGYICLDGYHYSPILLDISYFLLN